MRNNSKLVFEKELKQVKAIRQDKTRPRREYDAEMHKLMEIINTYESAQDLGYKDEVLNRIRNSRNGIEAQNILIDARRAC